MRWHSDARSRETFPGVSIAQSLFMMDYKTPPYLTVQFCIGRVQELPVCILQGRRLFLSVHATVFSRVIHERRCVNELT